MPLTREAIGESSLTNQQAMWFPSEDRDTNGKGDARSFFPIIPRPTHINDWLAQYNPIVQTFDDWKAFGYTAVHERAIYILPVGDFSSPTSPDLHQVCRYLRACFFGMKVVELPAARIVENIEKRRIEMRYTLEYDYTDKKKKEQRFSCVMSHSRHRSHPYTKEKYVEGDEKLKSVAQVLCFCVYLSFCIIFSVSDETKQNTYNIMSMTSICYSRQSRTVSRTHIV